MHIAEGVALEINNSGPGNKNRMFGEELGDRRDRVVPGIRVAVKR